MPLITLCGYPSSGKSTKARLLQTYLQERISSSPDKPNLKVHLVDDHSLGFCRDSYQNQTAEKKLRGALLAAVERLITPNDIVILDSNNYIKGLRYQLYCIARAISTPHCVIHIGAPVDLVRAWNPTRDDRYDEQTFEELLSRFEEPIGFNRWDSPLFTSIYDDEPALPFEAIWDAVINKQPPPPNQSTTIQPRSATNYLSEVDRLTNQVALAILAAQSEGPGEGGLLWLPMAKGCPVNPKGKHLTLIELKRLRRMFLQLNKGHANTAMDIERIPFLFIEYLNTNLNA